MPVGLKLAVGAAGFAVGVAVTAAAAVAVVAVLAWLALVEVFSAEATR